MEAVLDAQFTTTARMRRHATVAYTIFAGGTCAEAHGRMTGRQRLAKVHEGVSKLISMESGGACAEALGRSAQLAGDAPWRWRPVDGGDDMYEEAYGRGKAQLAHIEGMHAIDRWDQWQ